MWADPISNNTGEMAKDTEYNEERACSIYFGAKHASNFLMKEKLITIIRAHQVQDEGYKKHQWPGWNKIPMVFTIFSAPNYCNTYKNLGAVLFIKVVISYI